MSLAGIDTVVGGADAGVIEKSMLICCAAKTPGAKHMIKGLGLKKFAKLRILCRGALPK